MNSPLAPISPGELLDKITILEIKAERIIDSIKLANVRFELELLTRLWDQTPKATDVTIERAELKRTNAELWDIEDAIRDEERAQRFEADFIRLARAVYRTNDERSAIKKQINLKLGSAIIEEKSYGLVPKQPDFLTQCPQ